MFGVRLYVSMCDLEIHMEKPWACEPVEPVITLSNGAGVWKRYEILSKRTYKKIYHRIVRLSKAVQSGIIPEVQARPILDRWAELAKIGARLWTQKERQAMLANGREGSA